MFTDAKWIRVRQVDTGNEVSILEHMYDATPDAYKVLKESATDSGNNPLPQKTPADLAEEKKATTGRQADTTKEKN